MNWVFLVHLVITTYVVTLRTCYACNFTTFHATANACLTSNNVAPTAEFLLPILEDDSAVINFCTRTLTDIKTCIMHAVTDCAPFNPMIHTIFGTSGAPLLAAYEGLCSETTKAETMTCAYHHHAFIRSAAESFFSEMDELTHSSKFNVCAPLHTFHSQVLVFIEDAVNSEHCQHESHMILTKFLQTVEFRCIDIATSYYPCTAARINSNAIACYAASSVTIRNAMVPAPGLAHADVMCSSKDTILNCVHNHLAQCLHEEQASFMGNGKEYAAAYECMCTLHNADMVLSCPSTADTTATMHKFLDDVHAEQLSGDLHHQTLCSKIMVMKSRMTNAINSVCLGETDRMYWNTFLSTLAYPCTEKATACYPHMGSGSESTLSISVAVTLMGLQLWSIMKDFVV